VNKYNGLKTVTRCGVVEPETGRRDGQCGAVPSVGRCLRQTDGVEIRLRVVESEQEAHCILIESSSKVIDEARSCVFQFDKADRLDGHAFELLHEGVFEFGQ